MDNMDLIKNNDTEDSQFKNSDADTSQFKGNDTKAVLDNNLYYIDSKSATNYQAVPKRLLLKKNDIVEILIEDIGNDGEGIGKYNGFTLFVKDAVTGDRVQALILKIKKSYGYAKVLKVIEESPYRVKALCPVADKCGGCQMQHISYEKQIEYKQNKVKNCLNRIAGITDFEMEPAISMDIPFYYRNKAGYPVGRDKNGNVIIGFYAGHTHSIIDVSKCCIQPDISEVILNKVRDFITEENISIYDEKTHQGLVRHILTRIGFKTGDVMVCMVINGSSLDKQERLVEKLKSIEENQDFYKIKSVCINKNVNRTNVILGDCVVPVFGDTHITDYIGDILYRISPLSFFQINPYQTVKLYDKVLSYADLSGNEVVWDLYCGIGTISLYLAKSAKHVYGVEIIPQAIEDARENARINGIDNVTFFVGAAEEVLPDKYREDMNMRADVIVVDPPRKGCDERLLDTIVRMEPEKVVYVSCDSGTLARDVKYLGEKGYEVEKVVVVDQFGMTVHVEVVTCLHRVNS